MLENTLASHSHQRLNEVAKFASSHHRFAILYSRSFQSAIMATTSERDKIRRYPIREGG